MTGASVRTKGRLRIMVWVLGGFIALIVIAGLALQYAIAQNGPAVLNSVDRITGGARTAAMMARISTGDHPQQKLVVWGPQDRDPALSPAPVLVFTHGGSWASGDPLDYGFIARAFVPEGFVTVLVGYRLGEDGRYPAMLEDTARAIAWTRENIAQYGGDPERIVLAGHSAGAYNVVMTALEPRWLEAEGMSPRDIAGVIGLAGPYDFAPFDSDSTIASFGHVAEPDVTQPINHASPDAPQMLLIHGEKDTLVRPRNSRALAAALEQAGGHALSIFPHTMEHNDPLIALAAPWRPRGETAGVIADFARAVSETPQPSGQLSVPVQEETR